MQIKTPSSYLYIDDNDSRAIIIRQGYEYIFENGELVVTDKKTKLDIEDRLLKLKNGTVDKREIEQILHYLLTKHLESGRI